MKCPLLLVAIATLSISVSLGAKIENFDPAAELQNKENALEQSPLDEDEHELAQALSTLLANTQDYSDEQKFDNQDLQDLSDALADMQQDGDPDFEDAQALLNALSQDNENEEVTEQDKDLAMQALMSVLEEAQQQDESAEMEEDEDEQALINALAEADKQDEDNTMQDNAALAKTQQEKETDAQRALIMALAEAEDDPKLQADSNEDSDAFLGALAAKQSPMERNKIVEAFTNLHSTMAKAQWRRRSRWRPRRRWVRPIQRIVRRVVRRVSRVVRKVTRVVKRINPKRILRKARRLVKKLSPKIRTGWLKKVFSKAGNLLKKPSSWFKKVLSKAGKLFKKLKPKGWLKKLIGKAGKLFKKLNLKKLLSKLGSKGLGLLIKFLGGGGGGGNYLGSDKTSLGGNGGSVGGGVGLGAKGGLLRRLTADPRNAVLKRMIVIIKKYARLKKSH